MKKVWSICLSIIFAISAYGISLAGSEITVCGTGDSQDLLRILGKSYEKTNPGTSIQVTDSIGSSGGIKETAAGNCDLGRIARPIKEKEEKYSLKYRVFAISPVVFVTSSNVKVKDLTTDEITGIFSGTITSWEKVGGSASPIYVANRETGDSSRSVLEKRIPAFKEITDPAGKTLFSTPELIEVLSKYNDSIGYTSLAAAKGANLNVLSRDGIGPSVDNVTSGKYETVSPFAIIWKGELDGLAKSFYKYLFSTAAKKIINTYGAIATK